MTYRIKTLMVEQDRLSTLEAKLHVRVEFESTTHPLELRGRLVGPKCPNVETVQVAYPLRTIQTTGDVCLLRVAIPEPTLWTEAAPFVYEGIVELWIDGVKHDAAAFVVALKDGAKPGVTGS